MKYIIKFVDFLKENIVDWPDSTILIVLILLIVLIIAGLILWGIFITIDSWFLPKIHGKGKIVDKIFISAHTRLTPTYNSAANITTMQPVHHPDNWSVMIEVEGMKDDISIEESFYNKLSMNDIVKIDYVCGRISKRLYIKAIYP